MQKNITPLPWSSNGPYIEQGSETIAQCFHMAGHDRAISLTNAAFIVKACNSHDELVDKLRGMIELAEQINDASDLGGLLDERHDAAVALLAKLEAK